jgi:hypothetical protein
MFIPHENTGKIYIIWGETLDTTINKTKEFTGKRTLRALQFELLKTKEGGKNWAFVQYEDERIPLGYFTPTDLLDMGVLKNKACNKGDQVPKWYDRTMGDDTIGKIPRRNKVKTIEIR